MLDSEVLILGVRIVKVLRNDRQRAAILRQTGGGYRSVRQRRRIDGRRHALVNLEQRCVNVGRLADRVGAEVAGPPASFWLVYQRFISSVILA